MKLFRLQMIAKRLAGRIGNEAVLPFSKLAFLTVTIAIVVTGIQAASLVQFSVERAQTWANDWGSAVNYLIMYNIESALPTALIVGVIALFLRGALAILSNWPVAQRHHDQLCIWAENGCAASAYELYLVAKEQGRKIDAAAWLRRASDLGHKLAQEGGKS